MRFPRATRPIETALTLRLVFGLPLRQAEGFLRSVLSVMRVDLDTPDHTTLSRRSQHLAVELQRVPANEPIHLIVDSSGLSFVGEGEWAAAKHGGRGTRGWKKLHLGVDGSGTIVARVLTGGSTDDAQTGRTLIEAVDRAVSRVTADGAYDTSAIYEVAGARGATVVVPPTKTAAVSRRRLRASARDQTILRVKEVGRRQWKKEAGYHRQARVENAFFRYKSNHWRSASRSTSHGPGKRSGDRVQHPESHDRTRSASLICHPVVKASGRGGARCSSVCAPTRVPGKPGQGGQDAVM